MSKIKPPHDVGARVVAQYRIPPFFADEVLTVAEVVLVGRGKSATWRMRCRSPRGVEGWLDGDILQAWELGPILVGYVAQNPECTEAQIAIAPEFEAHDRYDVVSALQLLIFWGDIQKVAPRGLLRVKTGEVRPV